LVGNWWYGQINPKMFGGAFKGTGAWIPGLLYYLQLMEKNIISTPPKTNMEPEIDGF